MKMTKSEIKQLRDRWFSEEYRTIVEPEINTFIATNKMEKQLDLRGGIFGAYDARFPLLQSVDFIKSIVSHGLFAFSKFFCRFVEAQFQDTDFSECEFNDCNMMKSKFFNCFFKKAKMVAFLDDARFEQCDFSNAVLKGKITKAHGGRRISFVKCNLNNVQFKGIELRACKFVDCTFDGAHFFGCSVQYPKFEGNAPTKSQFTDVDLAGLLQELAELNGSVVKKT